MSLPTQDGTNLREEKEADETVHEIAAQIKADVEAHLKMKFTFYKATRYRTQTVRGTNFFIKLKVAGVDAALAASMQPSELAAANNQPIKFLHVRVWRDLPHNGFKLTFYPKVEADKLESDPILYFE